MDEFDTTEDEYMMEAAEAQELQWLGESWEIPAYVRDLLDDIYEEQDNFIARRIEIEDDLRAVIDWEDSFD